VVRFETKVDFHIHKEIAMQNLMRASNELFRREPDERFGSFEQLWQHCADEKARAYEHWHQPDALRTDAGHGRLMLNVGGDGAYDLNDWSFTQLCKFAGVSRDTVNRLSPDTASRVFGETMPGGNKPLQILTLNDTVRAVHGASYTRLFNADLLSMVREFATDFQPPQEAAGGGSGLYCGEQDMFVFLIDPTGWAEIEGEAFAPGFFLWNSEVGRRSVGVQTFWFQAVCQNHIVWDAVEVVEFSRKHTANVHDSFDQIRRIIENLVAKRDERRDGFAEVIGKAMRAKIGEDADEVLAVLHKQGITRKLAKEAVEIAQRQGGFTIFSLVDALTRISGQIRNAGDRSDADQRASALLSLTATA
jgi:predicted GNAT family acetyltransferase